MSSDDKVAIARAAYEAYVSKDRSAIEALMADDFHFPSPLDNRLDRATYLDVEVYFGWSLPHPAEEGGFLEDTRSPA